MTHPATLLRNSWHAYLRDFRTWLILVLPLAALSVFFIVLSYAFPSGPELTNLFPKNLNITNTAVYIVVGFILLVITIIITTAFMIAAILSAHRSLAGGKPNIKESYLIGAKTWLPVLWVIILRTLIVFGGLLLLVIPGIIWALRYSLATQVAVIEGKRGMDALKRSRDLTNGRLLETFINFGVIGSLIGFSLWSAAFIIGIVMVILGSIVALAMPSSAYPTIYLIISIATVITEAVLVWFSTPFSPLTTTAVYKDFSTK